MTLPPQNPAKEWRLDNRIHVKVAEILEQGPRGRLLDIACGMGDLALAASGMGYTVTAADINPKQALERNLPFPVERADLNGALPYADEQYDVIVCLESIEHVENHFNCMREFNRITAPGGVLIISTPNYGNIERRLHYLLSGCIDKPLALLDLRKSQDSGVPIQAPDYHINPVLPSELVFLLEYHGYLIDCVQKDEEKRNQRFLLPIAWLIRFGCLLGGRERKRRYLYDFNNSADILFGGTSLILKCSKVSSLQHS